jgi:eukaryotic-like serine/threonine-protein kinase
MGEVYRARDTRLDRVVAIKVLPSDLCVSPERKQRFEREARAISSLNHPNICTVHDVGSQDGIEYLVMEYLEGETLASRLMRGPLPLNRALQHGIEISDALDTAHRRGNIHRDLKPSNIFLTTHGEAKVLDFGLVKLGEKALPELPTLTNPVTLTSPGTTVGTVAYMSPEQARGEELDVRTDIFSFGAVLYETATGKMAFPGKTSAIVFKAILDETPPAITRLNPILPVRLDEIVSKALEKDRDLRYQSAADLRTDLKRLKRDSESGQIAAQPKSEGQKSAPKRNRILQALAASLLVVSIAVLTMWISRRGTSHSLLPAMKVTPFTTYQGNLDAPRFSPDGSQIAFLWDREEGKGFDVYVKLIGEATPLRLTNAPAALAGLTWSPDGHRLAVLRPEEGGGVFSLSALGGPERRLLELRFPASAHSGLDWSADGKWLAVTDKDRTEETVGVFLISPDTGERRRLTTPVSPFFDYLPVFSPDTSQVAFVRARGGLSGDVLGVPVRGGEPKKLSSLEGAIAGLDWSPDGKQIIVAALTQEDASFSLWRVDMAGGKPERLNQFSLGDSGSPAVARHGGRLAYVHFVDNSNIWQLLLSAPAQRVGSARRLISSTRSESGAQYSPDGKRIAFVSDRTGSAQIWTCSPDGSNPAQLTFLKANDVGTPHWSPDGRRIVFDSSASGLEGIYLISADGGAPQALVVDSSANSEPSFSHDGQWIYFFSDRSGTDEIWKMAVSGGQPVKITLHGGHMPLESPDGKFLYHTKAPSGEAHSSEVGLWQTPVNGEDVHVLNQAMYSNDFGSDFFWTVSNAGIYFIDDSNPGPNLKLFDPSTGRTTTVAVLDKPPFCCNPTLAVSPDGHTLLYSQHDTFTRDIMLVENFH